MPETRKIVFSMYTYLIIAGFTFDLIMVIAFYRRIKGDKKLCAKQDLFMMLDRLELS